MFNLMLWVIFFAIAKSQGWIRRIAREGSIGDTTQYSTSDGDEESAAAGKWLQ